MPFVERFHGKVFATLTDITVERRGITGDLERRVLARDVVHRAPTWCMIVFCVQDWSKKRHTWDPPAYVFSRWCRRNHRWQPVSQFKFAQKEIAPALATLAYWTSGAADELVTKADADEKANSPLDEALGLNTEFLLSRRLGKAS
jgi:hypothetical protein